MNNFDCSSSGVNIEFNAFHDICRSQDDFNENFKRVNNSDRLFLFVDNGNVDEYDYEKMKSVTIRGYSQGDHAKVIIPRNLGFKKGFDFESYFTNLFYDAPIYARLEVNEQEYYFDEYIKDSYQYSKGEFLTIASDKMKLDSIVIEWLENNLPDNLEYI